MSRTGTETTTQAVEREVEAIATDIQEGKVDTLDSNARYLYCNNLKLGALLLMS